MIGSWPFTSVVICQGQLDEIETRKFNILLLASSMTDFFQRSLIVHEQMRGKIALHSKVPVNNHDDLSLVYTPGVARPCEVIAANPQRVAGSTRIFHDC